MDRVLLVAEEPRNASELVEVPVTTSGTFRVAFPDNQQLRSLVDRDVRIQGMRLITPEVLSFAPINGARNAPQTEIVKCVMVLYSEQWEKAHYVPLFTLNDCASDNGGFPRRYHATKFASWADVDWGKSYILYANGSGGSNIGGGAYTFLFDVEYVKLNAAGQPIKGPY